MTEVAEILIYSLMIIVCVFVAATLGALFGAFAGLILGFTPLGDWILKFLSAAHIYTNMIDFGTFCGFVGGFFSASFKGRN